MKGLSIRTPEFRLMALVVGSGPLERPLGSVRGYVDREGRPVRVHLGVRSRLVDMGLIEPDECGWLRATPEGRQLTVHIAHEEHLRQELPHLGAFGGLNDERACTRLLAKHLPGLLVHQLLLLTSMPWIGGTSGVYTLRSDNRRHRGVRAPDGVAEVIARYAMAATVVLAVEELLRFEREAPAELLAAASLCWADDLVRRVSDHAENRP